MTWQTTPTTRSSQRRRGEDVARLRAELAAAVQMRSEHQSHTGAWFKVLKTTNGWVWMPLSCFLAANFRGPFPTQAEAIGDGQSKWK